MSLFEKSSPTMNFESSSAFCDSLDEDESYSSGTQIMLPNGIFPKFVDIAEVLSDGCEEKVTGWTKNLQDSSDNPCFFAFLDNVLKGMMKYPAPIMEHGGRGENVDPLNRNVVEFPKTFTDEFTTLPIEDTDDENSSELSKDLIVQNELISHEKPSSDSKRKEYVPDSDSSNFRQSGGIPVNCFNHDLCPGPSTNLDPITNSTATNHTLLDHVDSSSEFGRSNLVSDSSNLTQSNTVSNDCLSLELKSTKSSHFGSAIEELNINLKELDSFSSDMNQLEEDLYSSDFSNITDLDSIPIDCLSLHPKYIKSNRSEPVKMDKTMSSCSSQFSNVPLDCLRLDHKSTEPDCFDLREKIVCSVPFSKLNILNQNCSNFYECLADDEASSTCLSDCPRDRSPSFNREDWSPEHRKDYSICDMYYPKTDDEFETDFSMPTDSFNNILSSYESPEQKEVSFDSRAESSNTSWSSSSSSITRKTSSDDSPPRISNNDEVLSNGSSSHAFSTTSKSIKGGSLTCTFESDDGSGVSSGSSRDAFSTTSESNEDGKSTHTFSSGGQSSRSSRSGSKSVTVRKFSSLLPPSTNYSPNRETPARRSKRNDFSSTSKFNKDGTSTCTSSRSDDSIGATSRIIYSRVPSSSSSNSSSDEELLFTSNSDASSRAIKCNEDIESEMSNINHALFYTRISDGKGVKSSRYHFRVPSISKSKSNGDEAPSRKNKYYKDGSSTHTSSSDDRSSNISRNHSNGAISRKFYNSVPSLSTSKSKSTEALLACVTDSPSSTSMSNQDGTSSSDDESPRTINDLNNEAPSRRCKSRVKLSISKESNSDASSDTSKSATNGASSSSFNTSVPSSTNKLSMVLSSDDASSIMSGCRSCESSSSRCKSRVKLSISKESNSDTSSDTSKSATNGALSSGFKTRVQSSTSNKSPMAHSCNDVSSSRSGSRSCGSLSITSRSRSYASSSSRSRSRSYASSSSRSRSRSHASSLSRSRSRSYASSSSRSRSGSRSCESSSSSSRSRSCDGWSSSSEFVTSEYESLSSDDSESDKYSSRLLESTSEDSDWETDASSKDESVEYNILICISDDDGSDCQSPGIC